MTIFPIATPPCDTVFGLFDYLERRRKPNRQRKGLGRDDHGLIQQRIMAMRDEKDWLGRMRGVEPQRIELPPSYLAAIELPGDDDETHSHHGVAKLGLFRPGDEDHQRAGREVQS